MKKFDDTEIITVVKRILEGRLKYYDNTKYLNSSEYFVLMDACAIIEQLKIELRETKILLDESYNLIQKK